MRKKTIEQEKPFGKLTRVNDFLPPPDKLVIPEENIKVTILFRKSSVSFFKKQARRYNTKYQRMTREVVDRYASQHEM